MFKIASLIMGLITSLVPHGLTLMQGPVPTPYRTIYVNSDPPTTQACTTTQEVQEWVSVGTGHVFTCQNGLITQLIGSGGGIVPPATLDGAGNLAASVNSQFNVLMFGAKGDCTTNDHDAIVAAMNASFAAMHGNSAPPVVYFPKPPGNPITHASCYLTSTIQYNGVPLVGQQSGDGVSTPIYGITIRGMPGQDILHLPDPSQGTYNWYQSWFIQDISFLLDDSVIATPTTVPNMLHRWPGRWVDDGAITASSSTFTSPHGNISCPDAGQQILIGGAGTTAVTSTLGAAITTTAQTSITLGAATTSSWPTIFGYVQVDSEIMMYVGTQANGLTSLTVLRGQAGTTAATHSNGAAMTVLGNLATTISSVSPCWANANGGASTWRTITLATPAVTSISHAHYYISILDLPVATNIGNCSIAGDNLDAQVSDWPSTTQNYGSNHSRMINVNFNSTNGTPAANNHCGVLMQGAWNSLNTHHSYHVNFYVQDFGVLETPSEINPFQSTGGDFQSWEHMQFFVDRHPWISYNGGEGKFTDVQLTTLSGPQFMNVSNAFADVAGWNIDIKEFESWGIPGDTRYGLRVEGTGYNISGELGVSADNNSAGWIDSLVSICNCFIGSTAPIHLYGAGNILMGSTEGANIDNQGKGNYAWGWNNGAGYPGGQPYPETVTLIPMKGLPNQLGASEPDFAADGYPATPYRHEDLFLWPSDMLIGTAGTDIWATIHQYDTAAPVTGEKMLFQASHGTASFQSAFLANPIGSPAGAFTIGTNFPAAKGTLYVALEGANGNTVGNFCLNATNSNCSTFTVSTSSFAAFAIPFNFTAATGNITLKNGSITAGQDLWVAWAYIDIAPQLPAGTTIGGVPLVAPNMTVQTTNYTVPSGGFFTQMNCSAPCTFTLPAAPAAGFSVAVQAIGSTAVTISPNGLSYTGGTTTLSTPQGIFIAFDGTGYHSTTPQSVMAGVPLANQAACIKSSGPPAVIGYCSTVVGAGGACTCN